MRKKSRSLGALWRSRPAVSSASPLECAYPGSMASIARDGPANAARADPIGAAAGIVRLIVPAFS